MLILSRLSITEWRPITGSMPPRNVADWDSEFNRYRSSPEFKLLNPRMTLDEFKSIYYMEWIHRQWGRFVGLSFIIPAVYFIARRKVSRPMAFKILGIGGLIGFQGVLGWWMVKSGLKDDLFAPGSHPRVSQYRLVAHLGTAFLAYSAMLWNGLLILRTHKILQNQDAAMDLIARLKNPKLGVFKYSVGALAALVFVTAMSGGLVAGLDAGLIYNDFPWMGTGLAPPKSELFSDFYSHTQDGSDVWWRTRKSIARAARPSYPCHHNFHRYYGALCVLQTFPYPQEASASCKPQGHAWCRRLCVLAGRPWDQYSHLPGATTASFGASSR